ncbi:MAG: alanine racemase, partial [Acidimicrobiales bacterium]
MSAPPGDRRQAWAEIDLAAIEGNAAFLVELSAPAALCAVVKANGYGHGAVAVSRAALAGGAQWLAVALVEEGVELRQAGIEAPILVLSEPVPLAMVSVVEHGLTPTLYTSIGVQAMVSAARAVRPGPPAVRPGPPAVRPGPPAVR